MRVKEDLGDGKSHYLEGYDMDAWHSQEDYLRWCAYYRANMSPPLGIGFRGPNLDL